MLNVTSIKESSFRIAGPWVLGLFSLSAATFVVAAYALAASVDA